MPSDGIVTLRARTAGPFTVRELAYPAGLRQTRHAHGYMNVSLIVAGSIAESAGSRAELGGPLSVVVKPSGIDHADEVGKLGLRTLQVTFDDAAFFASDRVRGLGQWRWLHGTDATAPLLSLLRALRRGDDAAALAERVVDAFGSLAPRQPSLREAPAWLRRVKQALDDSADHASVRALAREAGVHEVTVSRAFRDCYGCSISEHRRRERLRRAARAVAAGAHNLAAVAHTAGYADHAHMTREFRRTTGLAPSAFRALARPE